MTQNNQGAVFLAVGDELLDGRVRDRHVQTAGPLLARNMALSSKMRTIFRKYCAPGAMASKNRFGGPVVMDLTA